MSRNNISIIVSFVLALSLMACSTKQDNRIYEESYEESTSDIAQQESDNCEMDVESNSTNAENTGQVYEAVIEKIKYLKRDDLFLLSTSQGEKIVVDKQGIILDTDLTQNMEKLHSIYLEMQMGSEYIYDLYGNELHSRFIKNEKTEELLSLCSLEEQDIVWVRESNETPTESTIILKAFDEQGNELCRVDSNSREDFSAADFKAVRGINYSGDNTCRVSITRGTAEPYFCINVLTGEILNSDCQFSEGYSITYSMQGYHGNNIQDTHGNYLLSENGDARLKHARRIGNGLFFNPGEKCFYNLNLEPVIDLSQYGLLMWRGEEDKTYIFKDGYCGVEVQNDAGKRFYGVIDTQGNWVMELTDEYGDIDYDEKLTDDLLRFGGYIYKIDTGEMKRIPMVEGCIVDGKSYYIDSNGQFACYDCETDREIVIPLIMQKM